MWLDCADADQSGVYLSGPAVTSLGNFHLRVISSFSGLFSSLFRCCSFSYLEISESVSAVRPALYLPQQRNVKPYFLVPRRQRTWNHTSPQDVSCCAEGFNLLTLWPFLECVVFFWPCCALYSNVNSKNMILPRMLCCSCLRTHNNPVLNNV